MKVAPKPAIPLMIPATTETPRWTQPLKSLE